MEAMQKGLNAELEVLKKVQKEYQKSVSAHQQLDAQLSENKIVKEELDLLKPCNTVYKMMGPVLVKQDIEDAKMNVDKRIKYITSELERQNKQLADQEEKMQKTKENLNKIQSQMQQVQMKSMQGQA
ncbi:prefoldin subunit 6 [Neocloeon triangulifer]|uniref:prefoldin subunit 6 n=1 Tax=Neocloeon triangulifer TaxID=2078957 RepID=UPI00286ECF13|nr:prefoldin subunit 6 [Neocloeon triangulifer]